MNVLTIDPELVDEQLDARGYLILKDADVEQHCIGARAEFQLNQHMHRLGKDLPPVQVRLCRGNRLLRQN